MATWDFSLANAIFSTTLVLILAGIHVYKMHQLRIMLRAELQSLRSELAPLGGALANLAGTFLGDRLTELENKVDEVAVQLQHVETMLEDSRSVQ